MATLSPLLLDSFIKDALSVGVGAVDALDVFRAAGGAIRTQTFLDRFRAVGLLPKYGSALSRVTSNEPIGSEYMTVREVNQGKNYVYQFSVTLSGNDVAGTGNFGITIGSNRNMSAASLRRKAQQLAQERVAPSDIQVASVSLISATHQIKS